MTNNMTTNTLIPIDSTKNTLTLDIFKMKDMSIEEIINLYNQGYSLNMNYLSCPSAIQRGQAKDITLQVTNAGTPPYTYKFYVDGSLKYTGGPKNEISQIFNHSFNESIGSHAYKGEIIDSCSPTPFTMNIPCTISITELPPTAGEGGISTWVILAILGIGAIAYAMTKK